MTSSHISPAEYSSMSSLLSWDASPSLRERCRSVRNYRMHVNSLFALYLKIKNGSLPVVLGAPSWLPAMPSVVLHSPSSFSSSSLWLSPAIKDWLRPLSLSFQFRSEELPTRGETLHWERGLFVGVTATGLLWETRARGVEVGGFPFLPKEVCPLTWLWTRPTPGSAVKLFELIFAWGLKPRRGLEGAGVRLLGVFFPLDTRTGTGGGDEMGAGEEGCGEAGWRFLGGKAGPGPSLTGETGGVWKLSPWATTAKNDQQTD